MDFARRQLEKYGWKDGKGLGKNENGISEALKPKLKRSVAGIGHDAASEFNEHWWETLYDKAATNIKVEEKNGKTRRIKAVDNNHFVITNSMFHLTKKKVGNEGSEYHNFIKKSTLTPGVLLDEEQSSSSDEEVTVKNKMTDEELFAACGGRTAHKGARHGLTALGKLARIEEQERNLLNLPKYNGYSHTKQNPDELKSKTKKDKLNIDGCENNDSVNEKNKDKKSKKRIKHSEVIINEEVTDKKNNEIIENKDKDSIALSQEVKVKKSKKRKNDKSDLGSNEKVITRSDIYEEPEFESNIDLSVEVKVKKSKKRIKNKVIVEELKY